MIISIIGKIKSGKDTVANRLLSKLENFTEKKFAYPIKNTLCNMIGCTREQLEDHEFKNTPLGEEWWYYLYYDERVSLSQFRYLIFKDTGKYPSTQYENSFLVKPTPRMLMQDIGKAMRVIHPEVFVNEVMREYKPKGKQHLHKEVAYNTLGYDNCKCSICKKDFAAKNHLIWVCNECIINNSIKYPSWVISDLRFQNEYEAVKDKGIVIRVKKSLDNRFPDLYKEWLKHKSDCPWTTIPLFSQYIDWKCPDLWVTLNDISETDLDETDTEYVITNNGSLQELDKQIDEFIKKNRL